MDIHEITYAQAINEGLRQSMELSNDVFIMGQLVDYKPGIFGTTVGLADKFGKERVLDFPVAENIMTSTAIGSALAGMRPVVCHQRFDFMMYSMDQIVNWLSLWYFKSNGKSSLPVTIRAVVGKGWGQGPQHSKSLHSWFAHLPGIKVALPATPHDAKGLLMESVFGECPAIIVENRSLFAMTGPVPKIPYRVRFGRAAIRRTGKDVTLVAIGSLVPMCIRVAEELAGESIDVEVIDLRTISPIDTETILKSVSKTRRIAVADPAWESAGIAAEILAMVSENLGCTLGANPKRISLPDSHTPMSVALEEKYYVDESTITERIKALF